MGGTIGFESGSENGTTFWFTVPLSRRPAEAFEDGAGVSIRDARLFLVSGRPAGNEWLARAAAKKELRYASFTTVEDALAVACEDSNRELCALFVDGEDPDLLWREVPGVSCSKGFYAAVRAGPSPRGRNRGIRRGLRQPAAIARSAPARVRRYEAWSQAAPRCSRWKIPRNGRCPNARAFMSWWPRTMRSASRSSP